MYKPQKVVGKAKTITNKGASFDYIREVWAAATEMQRTQKRITVRGVMAICGLLSTSTVGTCMSILVDMGYIRRGPRGEGSTWNVVVPLVYQPKQDREYISITSQQREIIKIHEGHLFVEGEVT